MLMDVPTQDSWCRVDPSSRAPQPARFPRSSKRNGELRYGRPLYSKYVMLQPRASELFRPFQPHRAKKMLPFKKKKKKRPSQ